MRKIKISSILYGIACATALSGAVALLYPYVSEYINKQHESHLYSEYIDMVRNMDFSKMHQMLSEAKVFNEELLYNNLRFLPDGIGEEYYNSILDTTGTGILGYIEIPKIDIRLPIYHGTSESVLQIAVGHMKGSSFPIGEDGSHAVLSGHNGLMNSNIFTELNKLEVGDKFTIVVLGNKIEYIVDEINVVEPNDFNYFQINKDKEYVTLVTCTPFGVNSHRLLVRGERVDYNIETNRLEVRFS